MALDPAGERLFVANSTLTESGNEFVYDNIAIVNATTESIMKVLSVQNGCINAIFYDPTNQDLYVASPRMIYTVSVAE